MFNEIFYSFIFAFSIIYSTVFLMMSHPLTMGFMLLIQTLLICLISSLQSKTFWFSYVLFLIFLGGMLVLFIYVISLASNEKFNFSINFLNKVLIIFLMISIILMIFMDESLLFTYIKNNEMNSLINMKSMMLENSLTLNKLYNFPINFITILLMIYLFLTLIAAVKITNIFEGPLRPSKP